MRLLLAGSAVLVLLVAVFSLWLLNTQAGLDRAVATLNSLDVAGLRLEQARGRLAGPLSIARLQLATARLAIDAREVSLDHAPLALLFGQISVGTLEVRDLDVRIAASDAPPGAAAPRFMPRWLTLSLDDGRVAEASLTLPGRDPLALRGIAVRRGRISHRHLDLQRLAASAERASIEGTLRLVARRPLRLDGEIGWRIDSDPSLAGSLRGRGDLDRLDLAARLTEPSAASGTATLLEVGPQLRFEASLESPALDLSHWSEAIPFGPLAFEMQGSGTLRSISATARASGEGLPPGGVELSADVRLAEGSLIVERLRAASEAGATELLASGRIGFAEQPSLDVEAEWRGLSWPLAGQAVVESPSGALRISGWQRLAFELDGSVQPAGGPLLDLTATGLADAAGILVADADVLGAAGAVRGQGYFGFGAERPWRIEARARDVDLGAIRAGLESRLSFDLSGSGRGIGEESAWAAYLGPLSGRLRDWPVRGSGFLRHRPGLTDFERFEFDVGTARVAASGQLGPQARFDAGLEADDLAGLFPGLGGRVAASAKLRPAGTPRPGALALRADLSVKGRDVSWGNQRAAVLSLDADVDLSDRETSWARLRAAGVEVAGQDLQTARLSLDGRVAEHSLELRVGAGERAVDLLGAGAYAQGSYTLTANRISASAPRLEQWALESPMRATVARDRARLEETCFVLAPRRVCIEGRWATDTGWSAALATLAFPLEALDVELPGSPAYRGVFDLSAEAGAGPGETWTGRVQATLRDGRLTYLTPSGRTERLALGAIELRGESLAARHQFRLTSRGSEALDVDGELDIQRRPELALRASPVRGTLSASTDQLGLLPMLVPDIDRVGGRLRAGLSLSGTLGQPRIDGRVQLEDGSLEFYQSNLRLRGVSSRLDLAEDGLELLASGRAGDGEFRAEGSLRWRERVLRGRLALTGERLLVADIPEARIEASPDLDFRIDGRQIAVTGAVTVPKARIEPRELVGAVTASSDERVVSAGLADGDAPGYEVSTDIRLLLGEQVTLDAFGLRGRLEGSILARTRPGEVAVASGELSIEDGTYRAYNKRLDVERGRLLFAGGPVADPGVDLRAKKDLPGYEVGVIVRGRLRQPQLSLYSNPSLPQSQIASLLLVGRTLDNLQDRDRRALGGSTSDLATGGGAILAGQIGRYVGLDEVTVETDAQYDPSLVLGKFLSPRLYVSYGISLTDAINTFKMRYTIGDNWVISAEAGQDTAVDIEFTIDR